MKKKLLTIFANLFIISFLTIIIFVMSFSFADKRAITTSNVDNVENFKINSSRKMSSSGWDEIENNRYIYDDLNEPQEVKERGNYINYLQPTQADEVDGVYQINNENNLLWMLKRQEAEQSVDNKYILNTNITFRLKTQTGSDSWWKKILDDKNEQTNKFIGTFDGNFHRIFFEYYQPVHSYNYPYFQGSFFQSIKGTVKNLNFEIGHNVIFKYNPSDPWKTDITYGLFAGRIEGGIIQNCNFGIDGTLAVHRFRRYWADAGLLIGRMIPSGNVQPAFKNNVVRFGDFSLQHYTKAYNLPATIGTYNISAFIGAIRGVSSNTIFENNLFYRENSNKTIRDHFESIDDGGNWGRVHISFLVGDNDKEQNMDSNKLLVITNGTSNDMSAKMEAAQFDEKSFYYDIDHTKPEVYSYQPVNDKALILSSSLKFNDSLHNKVYYQGNENDLQYLFLQDGSDDTKVKYKLDLINEEKRPLTIATFSNFQNQFSYLRYVNEDTGISTYYADSEFIHADKNEYLFRDLSYLNNYVNITVSNSKIYDGSKSIAGLNVQSSETYNINNNLFSTYMLTTGTTENVGIYSKIQSNLELNDQNVGNRTVVPINNASKVAIKSSENRTIAYMELPTPSVTQNITKKTIEINASDLTITKTKVYDGTDSVSESITGKSNADLGIVSGDNVIITYTGAYNSANVTEANVITVTVNVSGADKDNYDITSSVEVTGASITKKQISAPALNVTTFVYDGTEKTVTLTNEDGVTLSGDITVTNAGSYTAAVSLTDTNNTEWVDTHNTDNRDLTWTITKKTIEINASDLTIQKTKVYDGTTSIAGSIIGKSNNDLGIVSGDNVIITYTGAYNSANVTEANVITVTVNVSGADKDNYDITSSVEVTGANITKQQIALPALSTATFEYDNTLKTVTLTNNDWITLSGETTGTNAGSYTAVVTLTDTNNTEWADIHNVNSRNLEWNITKKNVTPILSNFDITKMKVYDGNNTVIANYNNTNADLIVGDDVTLTVVATYDDKNVATGKTITLAIVLSGTKVSNYELTTSTLTVSDGSITKKVIIINANDLTITKTKVYDGTTSIAGSIIGKSNNDLGIVSGDNVIITYTGAYNSANVTEANVITVTVDVTGTEKDNYDITSSVEVTGASITKKQISAPALNVTTFVYDGTEKTVTLTNEDGVTLSGDITVTNAGSYTAAVSLTDTNNTEWVDTHNTDNRDLTWTITKKTIEINASDLTIQKTKVYDGTTSIAGSIIGKSNNDLGIVSGDNVIITYTGAYNSANVTEANVITVTVNVSGTDKDNYDITSSVTVTGASITKKQISAPALNVTTFVYDGTEKTVTLTNEDGVTLSGETTGTNVGTYTAVASLTDVNNTEWADTHDTDIKNLSWTITKKQVTPTISNFDLTKEKVYDGNTTATATFNTNTNADLVGGDDVTLTVVATYNDKNVATGKTITLAIALAGTKASNYELTTSTLTVSDGSITKKVITINASDLTITKTKVYDGTTSIAGSIIGKSNNDLGIVSGDNVIITYTGAYNSANVTEANVITVTVNVSGTDKDNYDITSSVTVTGASITKKDVIITIDYFDVHRYKKYDGNNTATVYFNENYSDSAFIASDGIVLLVKNAVYDNASNGTNKTITWGFDLAENSKNSNYNITNLNEEFSVNDGEIGNLDAVDKPIEITIEYDGNTHNFIDENSGYTIVGTNNGIDVGEYTVTLQLAHGYMWSDGTSEEVVLNNKITKKQVTPLISNFNLTKEKVYDGNTTAIATFNTNADLVGGDDVVLTVAATYNDKTVATGKTITLEIGLSGLKASNYELTISTLTANDGSITKKLITIDASDLTIQKTKVYDGTNSVSGSITGKSNDYLGIVTGDDVTITYTGAYNSANVEEASSIAVMVNVSGADKDNYEIASSVTVTGASITKKLVTINASELVITKTKVYDGTTSIAGSIIGKSNNDLGIVSGDNVIITYTGAYNSANVTEANVITVTVDVTGTEKDNYEIASSVTVTEASITKKLITIDASDLTITKTKVYDGTDSVSESITGKSNADLGIVTGDDVTITYTGAYNSANVEEASSITVTVNVSGADKDNYEIVSSVTVTGASITKKQIAAPALNDTTFVYDGTEKTVALTNSDGITLSGETTATNAGSYTVVASLTDVNNTEWADTHDTNSKNLTWSIKAKKIIVTLVDFQVADVSGITVEFIKNKLEIDFKGLNLTKEDIESIDYTIVSDTKKIQINNIKFGDIELANIEMDAAESKYEAKYSISSPNSGEAINEVPSYVVLVIMYTIVILVGLAMVLLIATLFVVFNKKI